MKTAKKTLPTNEAKIGIRVFVQASDVKRIKSILSGGPATIDERIADREFTKDILQRVALAFETHQLTPTTERK